MKALLNYFAECRGMRDLIVVHKLTQFEAALLMTAVTNTKEPAAEFISVRGRYLGEERKQLLQSLASEYASVGRDQFLASLKAARKAKINQELGL